MARAALEPHLFVIIGGTGDLTRRKLLPALARLADRDAVPADSAVLAVARDEIDDAGYRRWVHEALEEADAPDEAFHEWCEDCLHYQRVGGSEPDDYRALGSRIEEIEEERGLPGNRVFYLALPPAAFGPTADALGAAGLAGGPGWTRLVVEKPFGRDLGSAGELNERLHRHFEESQIYRIDHYLGKETVQNLLVFRFANPLFESAWNRDRVESVRILVAESAGVGRRAGYYEQSGALRDMVQNHLTQLLALVAMDAPAAFDAHAIRAQKVQALRCAEVCHPHAAVFGQYRSGEVGDERVPGYREEPDVASDSETETFVALHMNIANWRWQGVPFFLRTGKRLPRRETRIVVSFRRPPVPIFAPYDIDDIHSNLLTIKLQPDEGVELGFDVKTPGEPLRTATQRLEFDYADAFGPLPAAYETLLLDIAEGDQTLFVRADEVEAAWRRYAPLLDDPPPVHPYPAGSWGPEQADELLAGTGMKWTKNK